jgi:acetyl esterase/lipase
MIKRVLFCLFAAIAARAEEVKPDKILIYKQIQGGDLTLHIFNPPGHQFTDKTPAIVFFFGGGWVNGAPSVFYKQSAYLASRGMVAICADYRTSSRYKTSPVECVKDGKSAMRWVRAHAAELGINPAQIAAGGGSAGGQVAAATATLDGFNEEGENTSVSCRPAALVLFNPVIDNGPNGFGYDRVKEYWQAFSPMNNIKTNMPPTLVMLGTADQLIPVSTAEKFKSLIEQAGARCDLRLYEGEKHSFFNNAKYYETLLESDKFLTSLGFLKGEPTLQR